MMRPAPSKFFRLRRPIATALLLLLLAGLALAALAPIKVDSHDQLFEIPRGTSARRMAGEKVEILPETIRLTLGVNDVLVLRNKDEVPHIFGPALIMPGQSFSLPFRTASTYSFLCTAHPTGQLDVIVDPRPDPGWARFRWRWLRLAEVVKGLVRSPAGHNH